MVPLPPTLNLDVWIHCISMKVKFKDNGSNGGIVIDNEETRLVLSTSELDGVFNPFYSSSAPDGSIVGMTQIGMISSDI